MVQQDTASSFFTGTMGISAVIIALLVNVIFIWSIYKTLRLIPDQFQRFPRWLCWLMLIPAVGFVISWIVLPFGVPATVRASDTKNEAVQKAASSLFGVGLAFVILITLSVIPLLNIFTGIAAFILWIIYWVKVVSVRKLLPQHAR